MPQTAQADKDFIGGYVPKDLGQAVRDAAAREERSISGWLRYHLKDLTEHTRTPRDRRSGVST